MKNRVITLTFDDPQTFFELAGMAAAVAETHGHIPGIPKAMHLLWEAIKKEITKEEYSDILVAQKIAGNAMQGVSTDGINKWAEDVTNNLKKES